MAPKSSSSRRASSSTGRAMISSLVRSNNTSVTVARGLSPVLRFRAGRPLRLSGPSLVDLALVQRVGAVHGGPSGPAEPDPIGRIASRLYCGDGRTSERPLPSGGGRFASIGNIREERNPKRLRLTARCADTTSGGSERPRPPPPSPPASAGVASHQSSSKECLGRIERPCWASSDKRGHWHNAPPLATAGWRLPD